MNYLLGLWGYVIRTRRLHARLNVFVSTYQLHGYSDINMLACDAKLKNARASWPFCRRSRQPAKPAVRKVSSSRTSLRFCAACLGVNAAAYLR